MSRITPTFDRLRREGKTGLVAYLTVGFPSLAETPELLRAAVEGGADLIELGIPFSDPLADGTTVQRAAHHAVQSGITTADVIDVCRKVRTGGIEAPIVAMGYYNPLLAYGIERFAEDAAAAGMDGVIPVDVPPEEGGHLKSALAAQDMDTIYLLAPTSSQSRIERVTREGSGFIYCVSVAGTTGARGDLPPELEAFVGRVREKTALPLAVGFGVSRPEHVARIGRVCEAAVVGSALIDTIERAPAGQRAQELKTYVEVLTGRRG